MAEAWVGTGLRKVGLAGLWSGVVGNQVKVLSCRGCYAEGLFHETVNLVTVSINFPVVLILIADAAIFGRSDASLARRWEGSASLALHLPVRQETARNPAGTP